MRDTGRLVDQLSSMALFADVPGPRLEAIGLQFEETFVAGGQRVLRQGIAGSAFYVILDGEAAVRVDGTDRATLGRGEVFGEMSILLEEPPVGDVVALSDLRCATLPGPRVEEFLKQNPEVMFRLLQSLARRLRNANRWRS